MSCFCCRTCLPFLSYCIPAIKLCGGYMKCLLPFLLVFTFSLRRRGADLGKHADLGDCAGSESTQTTAPPSAPSSQPEQRLFFPRAGIGVGDSLIWLRRTTRSIPISARADAGAPQYGGVNAQVQRLCPLPAVRHGGDSSDRANRLPSRNVLLRSEFSLRQKRSANALHLVVGADRDGIRIGRRGIDLPKRFEFRFTTHPKSCASVRAINRWGRHGSDRMAPGGSTTPSAFANTLEAGRRTLSKGRLANSWRVTQELD